MSDILQRIVASKASHIDQLKQRFPENSLQTRLSSRSLKQALSTNETSFILECKKASPSKGLIRASFDLAEIASVYRKYASVVSVLTDEDFFDGSFENLGTMRYLTDKPILCKDFFIDPYQIKLAAHHGADAILLMLSVLDDEQYQILADTAKEFQLEILTEVSNDAELDRAIALNAPVIGINNRNLRDLSTSIETTLTLAPKIPADRIVISESGIYTPAQVKQLAPHVHGFLIGSSLMADKDLDLACRTLIYGHTKVCGITRIEDSSAAANAGASYAGLIFVPHSPRFVTFEQAKLITAHHKSSHLNLRFVGVFSNQPIELIINTTKSLQLFAIQLHGNETAEFVTLLKSELKKALLSTQVWQAIPVDVSSQFIDSCAEESTADQYLYDSKSEHQFGGTGKTFDWNATIPNKHNAWLAGGLNKDNTANAMAQGFYGLDFNSGLEVSPGIKDRHKIETVFQTLRNY
ncbi:MAG: bifunctional indole-3-glycerol-phosphate synthase TrpC/phosphoribosylanthranilate isomerase TrpF [Parashewanella sp.]